MRDNLLKNMDFYNALTTCADINEFLSDDNIYVINAVVSRNEEPIQKLANEILCVPDSAEYLDLCFNLSKNENGYDITLSVLYMDKDQEYINEEGEYPEEDEECEEYEYLLDENDKFFMIEQFREHGVLDCMEKEISNARKSYERE